MNIAPLIAIVPDPGTARSARLAAFVRNACAGGRLGSLADGDGLTVIGDLRAPRLDLPGDGIVWGHVFDRMSSARITVPEALAASCDQMVNRCWGGYLAIRSGATGVEIFRDPSGAIPCYRARVDNAEIFTTRIGLLVDAGLLDAEIDWTILSQALVYRDLRPARTALRGVDELMPGTCATILDGRILLRTLWSLWQRATPEFMVTEEKDAIDRVRRVTTSCVSAWGRCFEHPLVELSGGLDSSIVAAALAQAGCTPRCITFASIEGDPDETPYARAVADHLGLRLDVLRADPGDVDVTRTSARDLPRPAARAFAQSHDAQLRAFAAREGVDAFFSGGGGDNVFAYLRSVLPAVDRIRGGEGGTLTTIGEIASLTDASLWTVLAGFVRRMARLRAAHRWSRSTRFVGASALHGLPFPQGHPWIEAPLSILPGKRVHGHSMIVIQNHLEGFDRLQDAPILSPLISQPLIETCMAIPTWMWCAGGMNRSVARKAFADRLPPLVIDRRTKGAFDAYSTRVFTANQGAVRDMLLDGALARQGLIDIERVAAAFAPGGASRIDMLRLLDLADIEAWVGAWTRRPRASPAA